MVKQDLIKQICDMAEIKKQDIVFEIGAGPGNLTKEIARRCKKVIAVEIDRRFEDQLKSLPKNVEVHLGNILDFNIKADKVIGNLPYDALEPIFRKLLFSDFRSAIFTVSRSFAKKLSEDTTIGVFCSSFLEIVKVVDIAKDSFDPPPDAESSIIIIKKLEKNIISEILVQDDKLVKNAARESLVRINGLTKSQAREIIREKDPSTIINKRVSDLGADEIKLLMKTFNP
jgi:16S rRNA (adenine1518-N6/adenine1519-N6)-dimethyltransferase